MIEEDHRASVRLPPDQPAEPLFQAEHGFGKHELRERIHQARAPGQLLRIRGDAKGQAHDYHAGQRVPGHVYPLPETARSEQDGARVLPELLEELTPGAVQVLRQHPNSLLRHQCAQPGGDLTKLLMRGEKYERATAEQASDACHGVSCLVDEEGIVQVEQVRGQAEQRLGQVIERRREDHLVGAGLAQPDAPLEVVECISDRQAGGRENHGLLLGQGTLLEYLAGVDGSGLHNRATGSPLDAEPVQPVRPWLLERLFEKPGPDRELSQEELELALRARIRLELQLRPAGLQH